MKTEIPVVKDQMKRVRITQFNPLLLEVGDMEFPEGVIIDFPPCDIMLADLSMGGIMPGAGLVAKDGVELSQEIPTPGNALSVGDVVDLVLKLQDQFFAAWSAAQGVLSKKAVL
jgi:hypothetical protein